VLVCARMRDIRLFIIAHMSLLAVALIGSL
jgi:hypothetical protein